MSVDAERATRLIAVAAEHPDPDILAEAGALICAGGLVAFPTETVYGLGANALDAAAVARIFAAKERPAYDPIIVHVADGDDLAHLVASIPPPAATLARHFWPGPLTLVLPKRALVPDVVTAGGSTVAVRCPAHPLAQALIRAAGTPIAAPSANRFSRTSPTTAQHVWHDLAGRIDLILDGGPTSVGVESTVLDVTGAMPVLLRPGGVTLEAIEALVGPVKRLPSTAAHTSGAALPSPGLLERHYAPRAVLWLFTGEDAAMHGAMRAAADRLRQDGRRVGLLLADEDRAALHELAAEHLYLGPLTDLDAMARVLYHAMRELDDAGVDVILARDVPAVGLGAAIRDRLRRAAGQVIEAEQQ